MRFVHRLMAAVPVALVAFGVAAPDVNAQSGNWMRDRVRAAELVQLEKVIGKAALNELLATNPEIIGGSQSPPGKWPAQVGLLNAAEPNNYDAQYCGGSVIANKFILTAAHCVDFLVSPSEIEVLVKTQSLASGGNRKPVKNFWIHPKWNPDTFDYDVAVIKLKSKVSGIPANSLITKKQSQKSVKPGKNSIVTGWGNTSTSSSVFPTELRQVKVPFVSRATCNQPQSYNGDITARMICAGFAGGGMDACQGDSGGPQVVWHKKKKWSIQAGIVSWGAGCAQPNFYGVYSNINTLRGWIKKQLNK